MKRYVILEIGDIYKMCDYKFVNSVNSEEELVNRNFLKRAYKISWGVFRNIQGPTPFLIIDKEFKSIPRSYKMILENIRSEYREERLKNLLDK
ncbi:MAG: hypothetical protein SLAVMIC_00737 [uncultured marine phage]|uniref:Uncharacterized protein n=1 Tax=uncultured marine phage TaxID=707152 RepID=A0A8D9CCP7_9VIRU|nr:MAG: hypothetical protein SLAVMIC_00737 [uncultured marine phage]